MGGGCCRVESNEVLDEADAEEGVVEGNSVQAGRLVGRVWMYLAKQSGDVHRRFTGSVMYRKRGHVLFEQSCEGYHGGSAR